MTSCPWVVASSATFTMKAEKRAMMTAKIAATSKPENSKNFRITFLEIAVEKVVIFVVIQFSRDCRSAIHSRLGTRSNKGWRQNDDQTYRKPNSEFLLSAHENREWQLQPRIMWRQQVLRIRTGDDTGYWRPGCCIWYRQIWENIWSCWGILYHLIQSTKFSSHKSNFHIYLIEIICF